MMNLMKENEENKKRMALSVICGVITVIAVVSLVVIASYIEMPTIARIALIVFAIITAVVGIGAAAVLEVKAGLGNERICKRIPYINKTQIDLSRMQKNRNVQAQNY